jgi:hypothetical protein
LQRVGPTRKVGISTERVHITVREACPTPRVLFKVLLGAFDEKVGTLGNPWMIESYVVRDEIEEEIEPPLL